MSTTATTAAPTLDLDVDDSTFDALLASEPSAAVGVVVARARWDFAAAVQFLHTFQGPLKLGEQAVESTESLELGISWPRDEGPHTQNLRLIMIRLLQALSDSRFVNDANWKTYLRRYLPEDVVERCVELGAEVGGEVGAAEATDDDNVVDAAVDGGDDDSEVKMDPGETKMNASATPSMDMLDAPPQATKSQPALLFGKPRVKGLDFWRLPVGERITVLHTLCERVWAVPDRFRQKVQSQNVAIDDEALWRVHPIGFDRAGKTYWLFDDNRLYVESPEQQAPAPRKKSAAKRRKTSGATRSLRGTEPDDPVAIAAASRWQLKSRTVDEWEAVAIEFAGSKDKEERELHQLLSKHIAPQVLEALREREKQRALNEQVRNRKRSSRIERKTEEERRRAEEIAARQKYEQQTARQRSMGSQKAVPSQQERDRQLKERQMAERERRRVEREQAIAMRAERQLQAQLKLAQKQSAMEATATTASSSTSSWMFRCACGVTGQNLDDGQPMVACEGCNEWQHISCAQVQALRRGEQPWRDERDEFICERCHSKGVRESTADVGADDDDMELDVVGDDGNEEDSQEVGAIPATSTSAAHAHMAPLSPNILRIPSPAKIATATAPVAKCAPPAIARIPSPVAPIKSTSPRLVAVPMASASPLPDIARIPSPVAVNMSTSPRLSMVDMIVPPAIARIPSPVAPKKSTSPQVIPTAHMPPTIAPPLSPTRQLIGTVLRGAFADALDYAAAKTTATRAATEQ